MPKVYVLNDGGHDYRDAERFGELVYCTKGTLARWDISAMYRDLSDAMFEAKPEDLILVSSLSTLVAVASSLMSNWFGEVHWLIFKDGQYVQRDLVMEDVR